MGDVLFKVQKWVNFIHPEKVQTPMCTSNWGEIITNVNINWICFSFDRNLFQTAPDIPSTSGLARIFQWGGGGGGGAKGRSEEGYGDFYICVCVYQNRFVARYV